MARNRHNIFGIADLSGVTLFESLSRNFVCAIDFLPSFYVVGSISIFTTARNQRLGDLVAGTLVVHEGKRAITYR